MPGYVDGDEGIFKYRGYPIEELAESSTYLEVACVLSQNSQTIIIIIIPSTTATNYDAVSVPRSPPPELYALSDRLFRGDLSPGNSPVDGRIV
ncbi:Citrate synthase 2 [Morus notabilis]|uniref:Citrate synthase 2 n=1 Tax=Morus notabilis TaxID=981085 RepID=W9SXK7_9ROSA|nr:Citrate synthase 2 [Morus notabilis]